MILGNSELNFPVYFNLTKISNDEYIMDPTPESIAFADYFIQNIVFVGNAGYDLYLDENMMYINGIEQRQIVILAYEGGGIIAGIVYGIVLIQEASGLSHFGL